ncbi:MAG: hypothetical protein IPL33_19150 [Sphingobacteriales bacterium]|nr:hypothetical protein [Sphingobacteriales bacterium]
MSHFFADEGWALSDFAQYFAVHCPKCQGKAEVDASKRLRCGACFHTEVEGHWYGGAELLVQVKCRECYAPIQARGTWLGNWNRLTTTCSRCGDTCQYEGTLIKLRCHKGLMTDPYLAYRYGIRQILRAIYFGLSMRRTCNTYRAMWQQNIASAVLALAIRLKKFINA